MHRGDDLTRVKNRRLRRNILSAIQRGALFSTGDHRPKTPELDILIQGAFIAELLEEATNLSSRPQIRLQGFVIDGDIDLALVDWRGRLELRDCLVQGDLILHHSNFRGVVNFGGSMVNAVDARYANIDGALALNHAFKSWQGIRALGIKVSGGLSLVGCELGAPEDLPDVAALDIYRASLGDLFLNRAIINGGIYAVGSTIERNLRLQGAIVRSRQSIKMNRGLMQVMA